MKLDRILDEFEGWKFVRYHGEGDFIDYYYYTIEYGDEVLVLGRLKNRVRKKGKNHTTIGVLRRPKTSGD